MIKLGKPLNQTGLTKDQPGLTLYHHWITKDQPWLTLYQQKDPGTGNQGSTWVKPVSAQVNQGSTWINP
jgi:hypothetical protein